MEITKITNTGTWSSKASAIQLNLGILEEGLEELDYTKDKGVFLSTTTRDTAISNPEVGDFCRVCGGGIWPGTYYICKSAGSWSTDSTVSADEMVIPLNENYIQTTEITDIRDIL